MEREREREIKSVRERKRERERENIQETGLSKDFYHGHRKLPDEKQPRSAPTKLAPLKNHFFMFNGAIG